jgi:uncharacterized protein with beta-barrel porin domain
MSAARAQTNSSIMVTFEGNGLETSSVANSLVYSFNTLPSGTGISATWSNGVDTIGALGNFNVLPPDKFGGSSYGATNANLTNNGGDSSYGAAQNHVNTNIASASTITFSSPISYFGVWWSAGDSGNAIVFLNGTNVVATFNTAWLNSGLTNSAYKGMPTGPSKGLNAGQNYAFLNFYGASNTTFTSVAIYQNTSGGNFELDNLTVTTNAPATTNGVVFEEIGTTNGTNYTISNSFIAPTLASGIASTNGTSLGLSNTIVNSSVLLDSNNSILQGSNPVTTLTISNNATASTNFPVEQLIVSNSITGTATVSGLTTNPLAVSTSTNVTLSMTNLTTGTNSGTVSLVYISTTNGTTSQRLGPDVQVGSQTISQNVTGYLVATPTVNTNLNVGNTHVGGTLGTGTITAGNTASNTPFTEMLAGNITGTSSNLSNTGTNFTGVGAGSSTNFSTTTITDVATAGAKTGTVVVSFTSQAPTNSGLTNYALGSSTVTVTGGVYNYASVGAQTNVNLGNVHVGNSFTNSTVAITNTAPVDPTYSETLATVITNTGSNATASGSISGQIAGASNNSSIVVGLSNAAVAGTNQSSVTLGFTSEEVNGSGLGNTALGTTNVLITGVGYNYAAPTSTTNIALGNIHVGNNLNTLGNGTLVVANTNPNSIFTETLGATFTNNGGNVISSGSITGLAGGSTNSTSLTAGLTGAAVAGTNTGSNQVTFTSEEVNGSGLGNTALGTTNVLITAVGYNLASNNLISSTNINLGKVHAGATFGNGTVTIANAAPIDPTFTEKLGATFTNTATNINATGGFTNLAAGATNSSSMLVGLAGTAQPGTNTGTTQIVYTSYEVNNSGLGNTVIATNTIQLTGVVYTGKSTWQSTNGGNWNSFNSWDATGGTPGIDGTLSVNDTATFDTNGSGPVSLNTNASIMTLTFSNAAAGYTINSTSNSVLTLAAGTNPASINNLAGTNTINAPVNLASPVALLDNANAKLNLNGVIAGPGSLTKTGGGTVVITGDNTYTGGTTLNSGNIVTTSTSALGAGPVTLNGGTLTAESSLKVNSLVWNSGVIALPNAASKNFITVTSNLILTGNTHQFSLNGLQPGPRVELLAAPNITSFSTSNFSVTGVNGKYSLIITAGALWVEWLTPVTPNNNFKPFAKTPAQQSVASALNKWMQNPAGDQAVVLSSLLNLPESQLPAAFTAMSSTYYQSLSTIAFNLQNAQNNDLVERLWGLRLSGSGFSQSGLGDPVMIDEPSNGKDIVPASNGKDFKNPVSYKKTRDILAPGEDNRWGVFVDANGIFAKANSGNMLPTYNSESGGLIAGLTYKWSDYFSSGIYSGYEGSYTHYNNGSKLIDNAVNFGLFGAYAQPNGKGFYADALLGGGYNNYNVSRNISFGSINRTATATPGAGQLNTMLAGGYNWKKGNWAYGPVASLQYTYFGMNSFSETGAQSLDLSNQGWNASSLVSNLGGNLAYTWQATKHLMVVPQLNLAWQHEFMQNPYTINSTMGGAPISSTSAAPQRDSLYTGVGATLEFNKKWSTWIFYNAFVGNQDLVSQNIFWGAGFKF